MHSMPLSQFAKDLGQEKAAKALGITQGSLSKALRVGRHVFVIRHDAGACEAFELRPFPAQGRSQPQATVIQWLSALSHLADEVA